MDEEDKKRIEDLTTKLYALPANEREKLFDELRGCAASRTGPASSKVEEPLAQIAMRISKNCGHMVDALSNDGGQRR